MFGSRDKNSLRENYGQEIWRRETHGEKRNVRVWKSRYKEVSNSTVSLRGDHETKSDRRNVVMLVTETT